MIVDRLRARWRWNRLLGTLTLDPTLLERPVAAPGPDDVIVCGSPRTGTALLSAVIHRPPHSVCVMEPWDGLRLEPARLFESLRDEIESTGHLARGRLDLEALDRDGSVEWVRDGEQTTALSVEPGWVLAVKWPAYWRYLDLLPDTKFLVCLRDPFETVASYASTPGRLAQGLEYDVRFNRGLNLMLRASTDRVEERRALLYETINKEIVPHLAAPNVLPVRYERWATDRDAQLAEISDFLGVDVREPRVQFRAGSSDARSRLGAAQVDAIRRLCPSAIELGYDLS